MKWDMRKSIVLTRVLIVFFALVLLALDVCGIVSAAKGCSWEEEFRVYAGQARAMYVMVFAGSVPAWFVLWQLWALMGDVGAGQVFTSGTVRRLRLISWCCFLVAALCLVCTSFIHPSVLVISAAAALMGLIVRVVKNVIQQGCAMKDELDLTV